MAANSVQLIPRQRSTFNERYLVRLPDESEVEAVVYRGDTLCISSQVGCAVACPFCASGEKGLRRPLSFAELSGQVLAAEALGHGIKRITISGVGEPLHNAEAVFEVLDWCHTRGTPASVTTSGGPVSRLEQLLLKLHSGVTISVHAGTEACRCKLVPKGPALGDLFGCLAETLPRLSKRRRKKVALAYLVMADENDSSAEVERFIRRAAELGQWVHLYAYNPVPNSGVAGVSRSRYEAIYQQMISAGLKVRMSSKARVEENGGCGTLVAAKGLVRSRKAIVAGWAAASPSPRGRAASA